MAAVQETIQLFPPIVETYLPAFVIGNNSKCKITFSISEFNYAGDIENVQVSIKDVKTNLSVLNNTKYPSEIMLTTMYKTTYSGTTYQRSFYYIEINNSDIQGGFLNNTEYKVQLRFTSVDADEKALTTPQKLDTWLSTNLNNFSEWSSVCIIRGISQPTLMLSGFIYDEDDEEFYWSLSNNKLVGNLTFADSNETDYLKNYKVYLYDNNYNILMESDEIYTSDSINPNQFIYKLNYNFQEDTTYGIAVEYATYNLYEYGTGYWFTTGTFEEEYPGASLKISEDAENGRIKLEIKQSVNESDPELEVKYLIKRTSSKSNFMLWEDLHEESFYNTRSIKCTYYDMTIESGVFYKYAIQGITRNGKSTIKVNNKNYMLIFDDMFLVNGEQQLKIKFNPNVSSLKRNLSETKIETLGSKYPYIRRNGNINYMQMPISGLISFLGDEDGVFISNENLYNNKANKKLYDKYNDTNDISQYKDYIKERFFREQVMDFLYNGEAKLFRSTTEGNFLVKIMDISLTPESTLGRMIYSFSGTAYEIDDTDLETLEEYGIISRGLENENKWPVIPV